MANDVHEFGGEWTQQKLDLLEAYMSFYTTAMKHQDWAKLHYIDGFAGTGERTNKSPKSIVSNFGSLFEDEQTVSMDGSVKLALKQPFSRYHFIELNPKHVEKLHQLRADSEKKDQIFIYKNDANIKVKELCRMFSNNQHNRGVIFVDPYGMEVD
jgi:three-Cys-motif partner protein